MQYVKVESEIVVASATGLESPGEGWIEMPDWSTIASQRPPAGDWQYNVTSASWVAIPKTSAQLANEARDERSRRLAASDWTQMPDVPLATKEAWATYRQALRDITSQPTFPEFIDWPITP